MMKISFSLTCLLASMVFISVNAQVITYSPLYPTVNDTLTVIYNAAQGTGELAGVSPVYAHTGVLTDESVNEHDWLHKPFRWGEEDSTIEMESLGNDLHKFKVHIKSFYEIGNTEVVREICFVFRNEDGSLVGKNADGSDIFIHVYRQDEFARFTAPVEFPCHPHTGHSFPVQVTATQVANIKLYHEGALVAQVYDSVLNYSLTASATGKFRYRCKAEASGQTIIDSAWYIVQSPPQVEDIPAGTVDGINIINDSTVVLCLYAPNKQHVYLIGDFNDWQVEPAYQMKRTNDGSRYWIRLESLDPGTEYGFQYLVDFDANIADPYADKFLDRWHDGIIHQLIYPDLKPYPVGKTTHLVSTFKTVEEEYQWEVTNFQKPDNRDLVIYEMLLRDFHIWHCFNFLSDTIGYFKTLGVNAIELMPVIEFDGYQSWGYMPAFHFAVDKYYGTKNAFKAFVDECHKNGIAVILDIVFNHSSGECSLARLYYNKETGRTTWENPWFNENIPHPFGFHHDFDHSSVETRQYIDRVMDYWLTEYKVDGFRLDLSKGFTNTVSAEYDDDGNEIWSDLGLWGSYDASRVYYIKRMADVAWANHPGTYIILEHFANNDEETELANYGFMLWGNANYVFRSAAKGYVQDYTDFTWGTSYQARGWAFHNLIGYMESHDEERMMYDCLTWGNEHYPAGDTVPDYSVKDLHTALDRMGMLAALFFSVPGPKMMWMFGEMGYDYSINWPALDEPGVTRVSPKPPRWDYLDNYDRMRLYKIYSAIVNLKTNYPVFRTSDFDMNVADWDKRIRLFSPEMNVVTLANIDVAEQPVWPEFLHSGEWYDYLTGDTISIDQSQVAGSGFTFTYTPGEYHIYTDVSLPVPDLYIDTTSDDGVTEIFLNDNRGTWVYPNPASGLVNISYYLDNNEHVTVTIHDLTGREVARPVDARQRSGRQSATWDGRMQNGNIGNSGYFFYMIQSEHQVKSGKLLYVR
ncbi:MAG: T9SS type A sorting domain-containing protein [Bacteroidetes bacterium]|nr:T9SS type A sorting domain-containing protein [Bacteroidota bacterium]